MNLKNKIIPDNEINLEEIILTSWKEKYLILVITLIFAVSGYIYGVSKPKVYQTTITLIDAPYSAFINFKSFAISLNKNDEYYTSKFNQYFKLNFTTSRNLSNFFEQNEKLDEYKSYLKKNNMYNKSYFHDKIQTVRGKKNTYSLNFQEPFPAPQEFFEDYVIFIKKITEYEFIDELRSAIKHELEVYRQNLEIAKEINLENPILKSFAEGNSVVNEPSALFYKGSKVISLQKMHLEKLLKQAENFTVNYNPMLENTSNPALVTKSSTFFTAIAILLGLLISIIFIFIRKNFLRKLN